ncbi:MAG: hypothetical protein AAB358_00630 [Patescibacteria group bacterium]
MKPEQNMAMVMNASVPMNGFCWAYCDALYRKIVQLSKDDRIFEGGIKEAERQEEKSCFESRVTKIAEVILDLLYQQIPTIFGNAPTHFQPSELDEHLKIVREALDCFEQPK